MWLKACPRCHGDLYRREEPEGLEIACLQCSRTFSSKQLVRPVAVASAPASVPVEDEEMLVKEAEVEPAEVELVA